MLRFPPQNTPAWDRYVEQVKVQHRVDIDRLWDRIPQIPDMMAGVPLTGPINPDFPYIDPSPSSPSSMSSFSSSSGSSVSSGSSCRWYSCNTCIWKWQLPLGGGGPNWHFYKFVDPSNNANGCLNFNDAKDTCERPVSTSCICHQPTTNGSFLGEYRNTSCTIHTA